MVEVPLERDKIIDNCPSDFDRTLAAIPTMQGSHTAPKSPMLQDYDMNAFENILHVCMSILVYYVSAAYGPRP